MEAIQNTTGMTISKLDLLRFLINEHRNKESSSTDINDFKTWQMLVIQVK